MRLKIVFLVLAALAILSAAMWLLNTPTIEVTTPKRGPAVQAVYATGTVEPTVMLPIAPRVTARLAELMVDEGAQVEQNQLLARLEDDDVRSALAELEARAEYARQEYHRQQELLRRKVTTIQARDRAKTEWEAAQAAVKRAAAQADFLKLEAPAAGRIIQRDGEVGELIPANTAIFWMSCCAPLRISAEVDEEDIPLVEPGQEVLVRADAFPRQTFHGSVQAITPKGDAVARSYRVRIALEEDTPLMIGMTAEANIIIDRRKDALLVPTAALQEESLWVVKEGRLHKQPVEIGARGTFETEIRAGLEEGAAVVLHPEPSLEEGEKIRTRQVDFPAAPEAE